MEGVGRIPSYRSMGVIRSNSSQSTKGWISLHLRGEEVYKFYCRDSVARKDKMRWMTMQVIGLEGDRYFTWVPEIR